MLSTERREDGFTLVELLVAMTVFLLVSGALLGALESGMRTERRASNRIDDEQSVRLLLAQFTRDVRRADAVTFTDMATLPSDLDLQAGGQHIRWRYDVVAKQLTREIVTDATTSPGISIGGVVNGPNPVFTLFGRDGQDLAAVPGATGADVSRCAVSVQAAVTSNAHLGVTGFSETAVGELHGPRDLQGCP